MEQIDDLSLELPLPEIADWAEFDDILELGSAGTSPLSSPSHYSSVSSCSSPFSTGSSISPLDSPDSSSSYQSQKLSNAETIKTDENDKTSSKKRSARTRRSRKNTQRSGETKNKRNERERRRVKKLSDAFVSLRDSVPCCVGDKKLSKLETLKYALYYMYNLSSMLFEDDARQHSIQTEQWLAMNQEKIKLNQINYQPQNVMVDQTFATPILVFPATNTGVQNGWLNFVNAVTMPVAATS